MKSRSSVTKKARDIRDERDLASYTERIVKASLAEDIGSLDITTSSVIPKTKKGRARMIAKEDFVLAGLTVAEQIFHAVDNKVTFKALKKEGAYIRKGTAIAEVSGPLASILTAERVALNFTQKLSGVATLTKEFVQKVKGTRARILDTRKTTPCMRILERYAVRLGGGQNHRFGLFDAILIKDNHIQAAGGVAKALKKAKKKYPKDILIEVEVRTMKELKEALGEAPDVTLADVILADVILLDNMDLTSIRKAIKFIDGRTLVEVSGGVNLKCVASIARTGADYISVGAITHSARFVDISLKVYH